MNEDDVFDADIATMMMRSRSKQLCLQGVPVGPYSQSEVPRQQGVIASSRMMFLEPPSAYLPKTIGDHDVKWTKIFCRPAFPSDIIM